jgi:hypothetical protein
MVYMPLSYGYEECNNEAKCLYQQSQVKSNAKRNYQNFQLDLRSES